MQPGRAFILSALLALFATPCRASPIDYTDVVVFGDSLSDVGNTANHWLAGLASFFGDDTFDAVTNGRFSDGPVWVEHLAAKLGLPGSASSRSDSGGDNYAHGGARTGSGTQTLGVIDNLGRQISNYTNANTPSANDLFVVWGGGNDLLDGVGTPASISNNMTSHVSALASDGATRLLVMNLPRLGDIPRNRGTANQTTLNNQSSAYNALLATSMANLETTLGIDITLFDVETTFDRLLNDPAAFGFTNTTQPAYDNNAVDPATSVFWDAIHPTTAAHRVLADAAFVALHDPGDFTGDGMIDQDDLQIVLNHYAQPTTPFNLAQGDWDGDGQASIVELDLVLANWTRGSAAAVNVPEPGAAALLGVFALFIATRSSPRRMLRRFGR
ncbi:MAG: SGNH/GDSL hydrolase family protein [Phycisphaeraceae bacterium]